ncbi:hypothetical protein XENOCAPTIV_020051 [Xenoophorus captivus]|uniref:PH domain-containing protein n=1 Tax=Xenoophorus captivus TaxID=1517983 RepID=A0ABV0S8W4_9TELE
MASIMEGPLSKWTNVMKGWQYRWFVLDYNAGLLSYYTSKDKMMRGSRRGCVRLRGAVIGIDDEDDSTFTITVDQKTFHFQARDADEREKWIHALEGTILRHTLQLREAETGLVPSVQDFDKKLAEADAYLQILIDQLKLFDEKIKDCKDDESRRKIEHLKETTCSMVESIKHCIVLLQIAKEHAVHDANSDVRLVFSVYQGVARPAPAAAWPLQLTSPCPHTQCQTSPTPPARMSFMMLTSITRAPLHPNTAQCDPSGPAAGSAAANKETFLKRPETTESLNSSMSNGTTDAVQRSHLDKVKVSRHVYWCPQHWSRLWRDVTLNLKLKDIDAATEAKHRLEEKQRAEARERKEKEQQWETRVRLSLCVFMVVTNYSCGQNFDANRNALRMVHSQPYTGLILAIIFSPLGSSPVLTCNVLQNVSLYWVASFGIGLRDSRPASKYFGLTRTHRNTHHLSAAILGQLCPGGSPVL